MVNEDKLDFTRVCIEIYPTCRFPRTLSFWNEDENEEVIDVVYEWRPFRCSHCISFGHSNSRCPLVVKPSKVWAPKTQPPFPSSPPPHVEPQPSQPPQSGKLPLLQPPNSIASPSKHQPSSPKSQSSTSTSNTFATSPKSPLKAPSLTPLSNFFDALATLEDLEHPPLIQDDIAPKEGILKGKGKGESNFDSNEKLESLEANTKGGVELPLV